MFLGGIEGGQWYGMSKCHFDDYPIIDCNNVINIIIITIITITFIFITFT